MVYLKKYLSGHSSNDPELKAQPQNRQSEKSDTPSGIVSHYRSFHQVCTYPDNKTLFKCQRQLCLHYRFYTT
jgi:hypothetical protein